MLRSPVAPGLLRRGAARAAGGYADSRRTLGNPVPDANDTSEPLAHSRADADYEALHPQPQVLPRMPPPRRLMPRGTAMAGLAMAGLRLQYSSFSILGTGR